MKPALALVLTDRDRRKLRGLLYGVWNGCFMTRDDYDFLRWVETRLAPSKMRLVSLRLSSASSNEKKGKDR